MSSLRLSCPHCGAEVLTKESQRGQLIACPECSAPVCVPAGPPVEVTRDYHSAPSQTNGVKTPQDRAGTPTPEPSSVGSQTFDPSAPLFVVDDYEVLDELARGGMGIVYRARQVSVNRVVALKMILAGTFATPEALRRFRQEAQAAGRLNHAHIVPIYDVGEYRGQPYFTMKLLERGGLHLHGARYRQHTRDAAQLILTVARAVHHAHQHGILHRDLKPSNILLDEHGHPHVTDFGLAKRFALSGPDSDESSPSEDGRVTKSGEVVGTPEYMAPEQAAASKTLTTAADVYGLGALLYALLTGRPPARGSTFLETIRQVMDHDPPTPRSLNPSIDHDLEIICLKCLRKEPDARYGSADELARELERWLNGEPIKARPRSLRERAVKWVKRRPAIAALLVLLLATVCTGIGAFAVQYYNTVAAMQKVDEENREKTQALLRAEKEQDRANKQTELFQNEAKRANQAKGEADEKARIAKEAQEQATKSEQNAQAALEQARNSNYTSALMEVNGLVLTDPERGQAILEDPFRCPEKRRDFSWGLLYRLCQRDRVLLDGQSSGVGALTVSADGGTLATHDYQGHVTLWDPATGKQRLTLPLEAPVGSLALTADGKTLVVGSGPHPRGYNPNKPGEVTALGLWDTQTGKLRQALWQGNRFAVSALTLSKDEKLLAAGVRAGLGSIQDDVKVWDLGSGKVATTLRGFAGTPETLAFTPDGKLLATASKVPDHSYQRGSPLHPVYEGKLQLWDVASGKEIRDFQFKNVVTGLCFTRDGKHLLAASQVSIHRWDIATGQADEPFDPAGSTLTALTLSPSGNTLAAVGPRGITLWDLPRGNIRIQFRRGRAPLAFRNENTLIASSEDGTVRSWDLNPPVEQVADKRTGRDADAFRQHGTWSPMGWTPDGRYLVIFSRSDTVRLRDAASGKELAVFTGLPPTQSEDRGRVPALEGPPPKVQLSADRTTAILLSNLSLRLHEVPSGRLRMAQDGVHDFWLSPDGKTCAAEVGKMIEPTRKFEVRRFERAALKVWDLATGKELCSLPSERGDVAFSPDGRRLAAGATVWEIATGRQGEAVPAVGTVRLWGLSAEEAHSPRRARVLADAREPAAWHPARQLLASARKDSTGLIQLQRCKQDGGSILLAGHTGHLAALAFSPDGSTLASAAADGTVRLWQTAKGQLRFASESAFGPVKALRFSADGATLIGADAAHKLALWDVATGRAHLFRKGSGTFALMALAPDGKTLATASGPDVHLFDVTAAERRLPAMLEGPGGAVTGLAFAEDGKTLTAWSRTARKRWDVATRQVRDVEPILDSTPPAVDVSADGRILYSLQGATLTLRDLRTGSVRARIPHVLRPPTFAPDGRSCALEVAGSDTGPVQGSLMLWDVTDSRALSTLAGVHGPVLFSSDSRRLVAQTDAGITVRATPTGKEIAALESVEPVLFHPDGHLLLITDKSGRLLAWEPGSDKKAVRLGDAAAPTFFTPEGKVLSAAATGNVVKLWDAASGKELVVLEGHTGAVSGLACSSDGKIAASQSLKDHTIRLWDLAGKGKLRHVVRGATFFRPELTFVRDGKVLIAGPRNGFGFQEIEVATGQLKQVSGWMALSSDGRKQIGNTTPLSVVDAETGVIRLLLDDHHLQRGPTWFTSDDRAIVSHFTDQVVLWDAETGKELASYDLTSRSAAARAIRARTPKEPNLEPPPGALPSGMVLITPRRAARPSVSTLDLHDPETGRKLGTLRSSLELEGSKLLALPTPNSALIQLWDMEAGTLKGSYDLSFGYNTNILTVGFGPDRKTLLALLSGGGLTGPFVVRVDLATGQRQLVPLGRAHYTAPTSSAALSGNGRFVAYSHSEYGGLGKSPVHRLHVVELGGKRRAELPGTDFNAHLALSDDGRLLASLSGSYGRKTEIVVWEWSTGKERLHATVPFNGWQSAPVLTFSADGKSLAASFGAGSVMLWDTTTGKERTAVPGINGPAILTPDGSALACLDGQGQLRLVEAASGKDIRSQALTYPNAGRSLAAGRKLSWHSDRQTLIVSGSYGDTILWDTKRGALRMIGTAAISQSPLSLAAAPDGQRVVLGGYPSPGTNLSHLVQVDTSGRQRALEPWAEGNVTALAFSPDGKLLALAGSNRLWVTLWDTQTWKRRAECKGNTQGVGCVAFSPDGKRLAAGGHDGRVRVWSVADARSLATFTVGTPVTHLAFGPDSNLLAVLGQGSAGPRLLDVTNRRRLFSLSGSFKALALSPDGKTLAVAGADNIQLLDTTTGKETSHVRADARWLWLAPDGKTLVLQRSAAPNEVILWDLATGKERARCPVGTTVLAPLVSPQGAALLSAALDQGRLVLKTWDLTTGTARPWQPAGAIAAAPHRLPVFRAVVSPDGKTAATADSIQVNLWDLATRTVRATLPGSVTQMVFSADGKRLVLVKSPSILEVWDLAPVRLRATREGPGVLGEILFSPDGGFLAYRALKPGSKDEGVVVLEVDSGKSVLLRGHGGSISTLVFSGDGATLATQGKDGSVRLWDVRSGKERRVLTSPPAPLPVLGLARDGKSACTISTDAAGKQEYTRWSLATGRAESTLAADSVEKPAAEATVLVSVKREHALKLVEPGTGQPHRVLPDVIGWTNVSLHFSADGTHLATVSSKAGSLVDGRYQLPTRPQTVQVWDLEKGRLLSTIDAWVTWFPQKHAAFSADNRLLALIGGERLPPLEPDPKNPQQKRYPPSKELVVWDLQTGKMHAVLTHPWSVASSAFSKDGKHVATATHDGVVRIWETATGKLERTLERQQATVQVLAFVADDQLLLLRSIQLRQVKGLFAYQDRTVLDNGDLKLWDWKADRDHTPLQGSRALVVWSPDRRTLATVRTEADPLLEDQPGTGYLIQVWDTATGHERATLAGHRTPIVDLGFSADGKVLVSRDLSRRFRWTLAAPDPAQRHYLAGNRFLWKNHPFAPPLPDNSGLQLLRGTPGPDTENIARAMVSYRTAASLDPRHVLSRLAHGRLLLELKEKFKPEARPRFQKEAVTVLTEAVQLRPNDTEGRLLLARALEWSGKDDEAIPQYQEILARDRHQVDALAGLGTALVRRGRTDEALEAYQRRVRRPPEDGAVYLALGKLRLARHEDEQALPSLRKAAALLPGDEVWLALASACARLGRVDEAIDAYRKTSWPNSEMHFRMAGLLERKGQLAEAVDALHQSFSHPNGAQADWAEGNGQRHGERGRALLRCGQPVEALTELRAAQALSTHLLVLPLPLATWQKEAERVQALERKWPALERDGAKPANAAETLECAVLARYKQRYLASARFFRAAFGKEPSWASQGVDRYNAACAAVLASAGLGKDAASLPEPERASWRRQALTWLQADLTALGRSFDASPRKAVSEVYPILSLWQTDPSLAGVRDRPEVGRLPPAEQNAWGKFWADVATLRQRATQVPTGFWQIEGKELVQRQQRELPLWVIVGEPAWTDYDFEVEAQRVAGKEGFGVGFRVFDRENHLLANFGGWNNSNHAVEVMTEGSVKPLWSSLQPKTIQSERWYRVRVEARGSHFRVLLDGKEMLDFIDADHPRGAVGLRSWSTVDRFRNLKVTDPAGRVLMKGLPTLPALSAEEKIEEALRGVQGPEARYLSAARLFQEAFAEKPALRDDMQASHRYNAACFAARAGTGQGKDTAALTVAERAAWRARALEWLRGDLSYWRRHLTGAVPLRHWQADVDLAGVRDRTALAKLPADERRAWAALWEEVALLISQAEKLPTGRWRRDGRELVQEEKNGAAFLHAGDVRWTDYDIEVEAQATGGSGEFDVLFRSADPGTQLMAVFGGWNNRSHGVLTQKDGGQWQAAGPTRPGTTERGKWYRVRVEARGKHFKVFLDGKERFAFEAEGPTHGKVGLRTYSSSARFRSFKVTDPAGKVLLDGLPAVPGER